MNDHPQSTATAKSERVNSHYDARFYEGIVPGSSQSAKQIVPQLLDIVRPTSVVDVGSGAGSWSSVFLDEGIADLVAIDGDYVKPEQLQIPRSYFKSMDLEVSIRLDRTFDLALCLEVAEHLTPGRAESLVNDLVSLAPVVAFSAAIPGQGGTNHINERWQSYWRDLFLLAGFDAIDCLRIPNWHNEEIEWWYRQNLFLYVKRENAHKFRSLASGAPFDIVHPNNFSQKIALLLAEPGLRDNIKKLLKLLASAIKRGASRLS